MGINRFLRACRRCRNVCLGRFVCALQVEPRAPVDRQRTEPASPSVAMVHAEEGNRRGVGFPFLGARSACPVVSRARVKVSLDDHP